MLYTGRATCRDSTFVTRIVESPAFVHTVPGTIIPAGFARDRGPTTFAEPPLKRDATTCGAAGKDRLGVCPEKFVTRPALPSIDWAFPGASFTTESLVVDLSDKLLTADAAGRITGTHDVRPIEIVMDRMIPLRNTLKLFRIDSAFCCTFTVVHVMAGRNGPTIMRPYRTMQEAMPENSSRALEITFRILPELLIEEDDGLHACSSERSIISCGRTPVNGIQPLPSTHTG